MLIVDCYNANPTSMKSAIDSFEMIKGTDKLLILGDMLELGHISDGEHEKIVNLLIEKKFDAILVGKEFVKQKSPFRTYQNTEILIKNENLSLLKDTTILLKGSRGIKLEDLIGKL